MTALNLPSCNLKDIPKQIGNLSELRWLNLEDNQLKELPEEICKLTGLTSLGLSDNHNLLLTGTQKQWLDKLARDGCFIKIDDLNHNA